VNRDKIFNLWWAKVLMIGVPFGVVMGLFAAHRGRGSGVADGLVTGVVAGLEVRTVDEPDHPAAAGSP